MKWICSIFLMFLPSIAQAATASTTQTLTITIYPFNLVFNPAAPNIPCSSPAGTAVATATIQGGDGTPVTFTMAGDTTDFTINASTGVISVGPNGIAAAECPGEGNSATLTVSVTASQN